MSLDQKKVVRDILNLLVSARQNQDDATFENTLEGFVVALGKERLTEIKKRVESVESRFEEKLNQVVSYLGLQLGNSIDYALISDSARFTLLLDNAQMLRCRYGLHIAGGLPDFEQYCIHAHYQCEALVNLFFNKRYSDSVDIAYFIDTKTLSENKHFSTDKRISMIPYANKLFKINELHSLKGYYTIRNINAVRNNFLHRDGNFVTDDDIVKEYIAAGLRGVKRNVMTRENQLLHDNYYAVDFKRKADYKEVDEALYAAYQQIANLL